MKNYFKLFKKLNINTPYSRKMLRRFRVTSYYRNFLFILVLAAFVLSVSAGVHDGSFTLFIIMFLVALVFLSLFFWIWIFFHKHYVGRLEQIYFDEYLSKNLKIFYHIEELNNFNYDVIRDITTSAVLDNNRNLSLILACHDALESGAEGIFVVDNQQSSIISGQTNYRGKGSVSTSLLGTVSIRILKNIREKTLTDSKNGLEYWFDLFQKGVITEEEYKVKKEALLNKED